MPNRVSDQGVAGFLVAMLSAVPLAAQTPVATPPAPIKVLKIATGPGGGEVGGVFALTEERSVFSRTSDKQVVVLFQWEAAPGPHRLVALWRSPDGSASTSSSIDYHAAGSRFGAQWPLYLTPTMPLGTWSVEATVDGQPGGRFTFEIRDEKVESPATRRPLSAPELYEQLNRMFAVVQRSGFDGKSLDAGGGFSVNPRQVFTSVSVVDGALSLAATLPDGSSRLMLSVLAWDRNRGWALLGESADGLLGQTSGSTEARVGTRVFTLATNASGGRVLRDGTVTGLSENAERGRRLLVAFNGGQELKGAPVLDEFGDLIGMVGGVDLGDEANLAPFTRLRQDIARDATIVPISLISVPTAPAIASLSDLQRRGEVMLPLHGEQHVVSGGFARKVGKSRLQPPTDQRADFSARDKEFVAFVNWSPADRLRGETRLRVYDSLNRLQAESELQKTNLRKTEFAVSSWRLSVPPIPGIYRADVFMNDRPIWRGFFQITP